MFAGSNNAIEMKAVSADNDKENYNDIEKLLNLNNFVDILLGLF